ncbi:MerR family transcriptional regulator [Microvirga sp. ACRRW]|uniref:MerR family transcriptional regulator n=1 Tax=Microvirga sp. ACRRW TaxID=2918205 RepID=UPI001EF70A09|nr:MerR family transcriptional regulator [Microvirga sp. ACRRW]MCG7393932.1 MerR family transcriptional regulator [Microvirga sp. ACRRW]
MDKSPDAFRTISEVAEDLDLPQHVLRFWETRFNHIKPLKRGGGRRYYRPDDVDLLKGIRHLLYGEGYTIKGVQRILKEEGLRFVQAVGRGEESVAAASQPESQETFADEDEELIVPEASGPVILPSESLLSDDALQKLRSALDELLECDRVLRSLKAPVEAGATE